MSNGQIMPMGQITRRKAQFIGMSLRALGERPYKGVTAQSGCRDKHCLSGIRNECNLPEANLSDATWDRLSAIVCFANADKQCLSLRSVLFAVTQRCSGVGRMVGVGRADCPRYNGVGRAAGIGRADCPRYSGDGRPVRDGRALGEWPYGAGGTDCRDRCARWSCNARWEAGASGGRPMAAPTAMRESGDVLRRAGGQWPPLRRKNSPRFGDRSGGWRMIWFL